MADIIYSILHFFGQKVCNTAISNCEQYYTWGCNINPSGTILGSMGMILGVPKVPFFGFSDC